jgi:hypothetical protein
MRCNLISSHLGLSELQGLVKIAQRRVARANFLLKFGHPDYIADCRQTGCQFSEEKTRSE